MTTGMYVLQGVKPQEVAAAPFDVKVVDVYNDAGRLHSSAEVALMARSGLLLGYFSIGEAETYRDYFSTIPKAAIGPENPQWKGNFEVKYWTPEWKAVAHAYIDKMLDSGYEGAYFDVVDECLTSWARANAPGGAAGAIQAMIDLIVDLKAYAQARQPGFKIWTNNAEELLEHRDYLNVIDGMFKENLFYTDTGRKQPLSETKYSMSLLQLALDAGKPVVSIEYVSGATKIADVHALDAQYGISSYIAHIDLVGVNLSGVTGSPVPVPVPTPIPPPVADVFHFDHHSQGDRLTGFDPKLDTITLDDAVFGLPLGELKPGAFVIAGKAQDRGDRIIYQQKTGALFYDPDGTGKQAQVKIVDLDAKLKLTYHDFLII